MDEEGITVARPFIKWVGGKAKLVPELRQYLPKSYNHYYEPFLGGGAFFFGVTDYKKAFLNDINPHLVAAYKHIRNDIDAIIKELKIIEEQYHALSPSLEKQKEMFLQLRQKFNDLKDSDINKATLLIFLNKTCFNGMYRENSKGHFNVPFGNHTHPTICDVKNLHAVSKKLQNAEISTGGYHEILKSAGKDDFVYLDPPYYPLNPTSNFTSYHSEGFNHRDQLKLSEIFKELKERGSKVMVSNSTHEEVYKMYEPHAHIIQTIDAARAINSKGSDRGKIKELVILSYNPHE